MDFEYIVNLPEKEPLCFGSKMERVTLPNDSKYQNTFMRRRMVKVNPNLGPATYNNERGAFYDLDHKPCSILGLGSKEPRWLEKHEYQPPLQKLPPPVKPKQNCAPFNQTSRRKTLMKTSDNPAPCDYLPGVKEQGIKFNYCFNSKKELRCAVSVSVFYCHGRTVDFEYIVNLPEKEPLCFGSKMERVTLPNDSKYQNTFMRRRMVKVNPNLGPATYNNERGAFYDLDHKPCSILGLGSKEPRWLEKHEYQPPLQKLPPPVKPKQNCAPFNQTSRRKTLMKTSDNPAPCDYLPGVKEQGIKFNYCFNSKKELRCAVSIKCVPYNLDECAACGCSCSAQGDYWHFKDKLFLCRKHYSQRFKTCNSKYRGVKLSEFEPVRDCFFMHSHNSCKASIKIMRREDIVKKLRKEAYLDIYFPQRHRTCM